MVVATREKAKAYRPTRRGEGDLCELGAAKGLIANQPDALDECDRPAVTQRTQWLREGGDKSVMDGWNVSVRCARAAAPKRTAAQECLVRDRVCRDVSVAGCGVRLNVQL